VRKITGAHLPSLGYKDWIPGTASFRPSLICALPGDFDILRGLVRKADVFSQDTVLAPWRAAAVAGGAGCDPTWLVYVSLGAFGHAGPWASRRGFDTVVQDRQRHHATPAECIPGRSPGPQFYPVSAIDYCTGYLMAFGAMVALARRAREGGSWLVRISLAQVGKWIVDLGEVPARRWRYTCRVHLSELERWSTVSESSIRPAPPPQASRAVVRNPAVLGAALGCARLSPPRVAVKCGRACRGGFQPAPTGLTIRALPHDRSIVMSLPRRQFLHLAAGALAAPAVGSPCLRGRLSEPAVRLLVGFTPAGGNDIMRA